MSATTTESLADMLRSALADRVRSVGLSEVARATGIAQPNLSAWLSGKRSMPDANIDAIAASVGVRLRVTASRSSRHR